MDNLIIPHPEADDPRRIVPLEGAFNFRDLGGYRTVDGRTTRWNQLYRSGKLNELTDTDLHTVASLGLHTVYDLRSENEAKEEPDRLPVSDALMRLHRPIVDPARFSRARMAFAAVFRRNRLIKLFREGYTRIILDGNADIIGELLTAMANGEKRPLLFHCTAGKDRTGVISAVALELVGVPCETILADYALSNHYTEQLMESMRDNVHMRRVGMTVEDVRPLMAAEPINLHQMYAWIDERYGSTENYVLARTGVNHNLVNQLQRELLE